MNKLQKQQGDVNVVYITKEQFDSLALGAKEIKGGAVREGEGTHTHKMFGTDFRLLQMGEIILGEMISNDCALRHVNVDDTQAEHEVIPMEKRYAMFTPTTEYDHFAERARRVVD